jgi:hypothetical protein
MKRRISAPEAILAGLVVAHLGVSLVHGYAHSSASVPLSAGQMVFVFGVILVGPVLGLIVHRFALPRAGAWVIAVSLGGALVFGLANHFLIAGADHVSHVAAPWRPLFGITAALLVVTEAFGSIAAVWCAATARRMR